MSLRDWFSIPTIPTPAKASAISGPPPRAAAVIGKAALGGEAIWNGYNVPRDALRRSPLKMMREAQAQYWAHPWIGSAEDTVTRKVKGLPYHVEDQDEKTVDDEERNPELQRVKALLEKPQAALPEDQRQVGYSTWVDLVGITSRHVGLCGISYWFKDMIGQDGFPDALLYVNPARLLPNLSAKGMLIDYILDPIDESGRGGTRIPRERIIPFYLSPPDWGALPMGLVERAQLKARLSTLADQHMGGVLTTGGRIPGLIAPKDRYIDDPKVYDQLVRDIRVSREGPDAAMRDTILRGPIDFFETGGDSAELQLQDVSKLTRDDIFTIWGAPPSQAGVSGTSTGLNSGETRRYEYQVLMEGPVHDRVVVISQSIQLLLLDLLDPAPQFVMEEPDFEDDTVRYEMAAKAREQPLTVNERRAILELDPLPDYGPDGEPLGVAVVLPTVLSTWSQGPDEKATEGNPFPGAPNEEPVPVRVLPPPQLTAGGLGSPPVSGAGGTVVTPSTAPPVAKASERQFLGLRRAVDTRFVPPLMRDVGKVLRAQRESVIAKLRTRGTSGDPERLWDGPGEDKRLAKAIAPHLSGIAQTVAQRTTSLMALGKADPFEERVMEELRDQTASRVTGINEHTRDLIVQAIREGVEEGMTIDEIALKLRDLPAFDEARAELVARTESAFTYNAAAVSSYSEFGVGQVEVIDGDGDEICAPLNGAVWTLDEAAANPLGHPNCTRDFVPVFA